VSSTVSHRERALRFRARQLLMEQLRRSVEQIDNDRGSPAQGVTELPRKLDPAQGVSRLDRPAIERLNELSLIPEAPGMRR
jgi:hypothetical protein